MTALEDARIAGPEYADLRERYREHRHRFGYHHMIETALIRERLEAEGVPPERLHFAVSRAYEEAHKDDPSFRDTSAAFLASARRATRGEFFDEAELAFLAEHFDGANDPVAAGILDKVKAALAALS